MSRAAWTVRSRGVASAPTPRPKSAATPILSSGGVSGTGAGVGVTFLFRALFAMPGSLPGGPGTQVRYGEVGQTVTRGFDDLYRTGV